MSIQLSDEQRGILHEVTALGTPAKRTSQAENLRQRRYLGADYRATIHGYWALNKYKHIPSISFPTPMSWSKDADRHLVIAETFMIGKRGAFSPDYRISIRSLMELYERLVVAANIRLEKHIWSKDLDVLAEESHLTIREIKRFQSAALKQAVEDMPIKDTHLASVCAPIAQAYLANPKSFYFQASATMRFAFEDSGWEHDAWVKMNAEERMAYNLREAKTAESLEEQQRLHQSSVRRHIEMARKAVPASLILA